ncbi:transglycosylase SLT domain-containing protein [Actinomadura keratinilytica]
MMRRLATPKKIAVGTALAASAASLAFTAAPAQAAEGSPQAIAQQMIGDDAQYQAFSNIVERESGWDPHATNDSSGAYGLVQALLSQQDGLRARTGSPTPPPRSSGA